MTTEMSETERALRAAMCQWCKDGHKLESSDVHRIEKQHQTFDDFELCTYKPEFLPLFNAGIAGAYAAAAKVIDQEVLDRAKFESHMLPIDELAKRIRSLTPDDKVRGQS